MTGYVPSLLAMSEGEEVVLETTRILKLTGRHTSCIEPFLENIPRYLPGIDLLTDCLEAFWFLLSLLGLGE